MNYEDRTDLEAPDSLVGPRTLAAMASAWAGAKDQLAEAFAPSAKPVDESIEALLTEVIRPHVELQGAPPQALPLGLAAARAGYRLGNSMLRGRVEGGGRQGDTGRLADVVHRMHVYGLYYGTSFEDFGQALQSQLATLITNAGAPQRGDFEEVANLCFSLGLATAVVQFDRARISGGSWRRWLGQLLRFGTSA